MRLFFRMIVILQYAIYTSWIIRNAKAIILLLLQTMKNFTQIISYNNWPTTKAMFLFTLQRIIDNVKLCDRRNHWIPHITDPSFKKLPLFKTHTNILVELHGSSPNFIPYFQKRWIGNLALLFPSWGIYLLSSIVTWLQINEQTGRNLTGEIYS